MSKSPSNLKKLSKQGNCAGCAKSLPKSEFMRCTACKALYDLECANVSSARFYASYAAGSERTSTWRCPECLSKLPKRGNTETPVRSGAPCTDGENVTHRVKRNTASVREDESVEGNRTDCDRFELLLNEIRGVREEMSMMNSAMANLYTTIKEQNTRIDSLEARIENMETGMSKNNDTDLRVLQETIQQLQLDIQDRDQQILANDVEISSLPEQPNENPTHVFLTLAKKLGLNLDESDVVNAERAGPVRARAGGAYGAGGAEGPVPRPRPLVARLARRSARDALLRAARVRRGATTEGTGLAPNAARFYVNERLTKTNRQLFQKARETAKQRNWRYIWTRDGKVFARREQGGTVHRVRVEADLSKVFGSDPVRAGSAGTQ